MLSEADKRVVRAFVDERAADSRLLETDGVRLDKIGLGGETVAKWIDGRIAIVSTESVKSDESIIRLIKSVAGPGVVDFSYARKGHRVHEHGAMGRNGRGVYHETPAGKHDMVIHQDHRGSWRIDLVTSAGGNHTDVTGPNRGYGSPEEAFQAALDVQRTRGIRGKSHVYIADRDGNLSDYEPMERNARAKKAAPATTSSDVRSPTRTEVRSPTRTSTKAYTRGNFTSTVTGGAGAGETSVTINLPGGGYQGNGRAADDGTQEGDYVLAIVDRDANIGLYRVVRGGKWFGPIQTSANVDTIIGFMEGDAHKRGIHAAAVFEQDGDRFTQIGNMNGSRYQESGGYQGNGRSSSATRQDLEAAYYYNERKIADAEEELRRPGISSEYRQQLRDMIASAKSDMEYARGRLEPNGTTVDPVAARELDLYIANTFELVGAPNSIGKAIDASMKRKLASGRYDSALAPKGWQPLVDAGAKKYEREFGSDSPIFNAATRRQVATDFARAWEEENGIVEAERIR